MNYWRKITAVTASAAAVLIAVPAQSADLVVWGGGAVKSALTDLMTDFQATSGTKIVSEFAPMGPLIKKLKDNPAGADIVVLSAEVMADAIKSGLVADGSVTEVGRVGVGVAVNEKAPLPDISTAAAFKATLLAAKSIVMVDPATGTSGKHLAEVFQKLGVAEEIKARTTLLPGGYVVELVGKGEIELGLHQITEILPVKGIKLVGPLPAELQKVTIYQAGIATKATNPEGAKTFLTSLGTPKVRASIASKGFIVQ